MLKPITPSPHIIIPESIKRRGPKRSINQPAANPNNGPIIIFPANGHCSKCGSDLMGKNRVVKKYQSKMKVRCEVCQHEQFYKTRFTEIQANDEQATDPYLGLPLWLQVPVGDNILWAYNYDHLELLKNYVSAKLREAQSGGKNSLIWKLPNFIRVAKNRDKILKAISRLEKKLL